jgi:hypothetical protein
MANCAECGEPLKEGAWVCGKCGTPVASTEPKSREASEGYSAYYKGSDETPPPELQATGSTQANKGGLSRGSWMIIGVGLAVVLAIFIAWFFFLRNGDASAFVGTWVPVDPTAKTFGALVIAKSGGGVTVTTVITNGQQVGPLKAHMNGNNLEFDFTPAGGTAEQKVAIQALKAFMGALIKELKFVLTHNPGDTLTLKAEGKPVVGATGPGLGQAIQLQRGALPTASPTP